MKSLNFCIIDIKKKFFFISIFTAILNLAILIFKVALPHVNFSQLFLFPKTNFN